MQVDSPSAVRATALFGFSGSLEPTRLAWAYRGGLAVVAVGMLILPLLYGGVLALAGSGMWWHVTHNAWLLNGSTGGLLRLIAYGGPALAGAVVLLFMVKPVFVRPPAPEPLIEVTEAAAPMLFAYIAEICGQVGAPVPWRVQVDCHVNASASFDRGVGSFFRRDLVLTIGLPLVADLSVRELGGVLAHEFGHFAQGSGLRLTRIIRGVNGWFARVVYERDIWDWRLAAWSEQSDIRFKLLLLPSQAGVVLSRLALKGLMTAGQAISSFLLRQMEYDADSYQIKLAGTPSFTRTMRRVQELSFAAHRCEGDVQACRQGGTMPADLPQFLVEWASRLPAEPPAVAAALKPPGFFDTHPTHAQRVHAAEAASAPGILVGGDGSARHLFVDFDALCARATRRHYEKLRLRLEDLRLIDTAEAMRASLARVERQTGLGEIFDRGLSLFRPAVVPAPGAEAGDVQAWRLPNAVELYANHFLQRNKAFAAQQLFHAGIDIYNPATFDLRAWTLEAATHAEAEALDRLRMLGGLLEPYERRCMVRIARGLAHAAASDATDSGNIAALITAFNAASAGLLASLDLQRLIPIRNLLGQLLDSAACSDPDRARIRHTELSAAVSQASERMRQAVLDVACPRALASSHATLDLECGMPAGDDPTPAMRHLETMYLRLLLELCVIVRRAERAW